MAMASALPSVAAISGGGSGGGSSSCKPSSSLSFVKLSSSASPFPRPLPSFRMRAQPPPISELDTAAFEADRLRLDAQARLDMMQVAAAAEEGAVSASKEGSTTDAESGGTPASPEVEEDAGAWKWRIRKRIWDLMERENIAVHPRPVHHRIPNFVGAATAAAKLASLPAFQAANCVKVNPDTPQKQVRYLTLEGNKKLLTPQPRLRTGFFSELEASSLPSGDMAEACTAVGVAKYGKPLGLDAKLKVDLIVIGSVAVDPKTGARLGKGEGFAELEYAILRHMGAIDDSTLVVTSVHDKQLVDDIPTEKLKVHDVPVDVICTPTHIIHTKTTIPKPKGIYWELLSPEKLGQILVLRQLKEQIEKETGQKLPRGPSEKLPPTAQRRPIKQLVASEKASNEPCIFVSNLDISTTWKELKEHVSKAGVEAVKVNISRKVNSRPIAHILLKEGTDVEVLVKALDSSQLGGSTIRAKINRVPEKPLVSSQSGGPIKQLVASEKASKEPCIFVWNLDISTTWKELQEHVSKAGAEAVKVNILRKDNTRPMARILLKEGTNIEVLVKALDSSQLGGSNIRAKINSIPEKALVSSQSGGSMVKVKVNRVPEKANVNSVPEKVKS